MQRTTQLVGELSSRDAHFRALWAGHAVVARVDRPPVRFAHPVVGMLTLTRENLAIDGPAPLRLMIYHADRDSDDHEQLRRLGAVARST